MVVGHAGMLNLFYYQTLLLNVFRKNLMRIILVVL
jgi:hypothetical protein